MKKSLIAILIIAMTTNLKAQIKPVTSFGFGYEVQNSAIPVQLTVGANQDMSEVVAGYTVFFHRNDATIPKILFLRYGLNVSKGSLEIMPLIGIGMLTATTYEKLIDDYEIIKTPSELKLLYGLKVQKNIGLGGLFVSVEHCKLNVITTGMFIKVN